MGKEKQQNVGTTCNILRLLFWSLITPIMYPWGVRARDQNFGLHFRSTLQPNNATAAWNIKIDTLGLIWSHERQTCLFQSVFNRNTGLYIPTVQSTQQKCAPTTVLLHKLESVYIWWPEEQLFTSCQRFLQVVNTSIEIYFTRPCGQQPTDTNIWNCFPLNRSINHLERKLDDPSMCLGQSRPTRFVHHPYSRLQHPHYGRHRFTVA